MATWEAMICCQCGHPTAPMPYPYQWMTTCHVCSHEACLACNFNLDPNQYLNPGQVLSLETTTWDSNNVYKLTEAGSVRADNGGESDLEKEIPGNGQIRDDLQALSDRCGFEDFLKLVELSGPQVPPTFQQQFSELTPPLSSIDSVPRKPQHLNNDVDISSGEKHIKTTEEQIAAMPRNLEWEVLETSYLIENFYPLATSMEHGEEIPDFLDDAPFFLADETFGMDTPSSGQ